MLVKDFIREGFAIERVVLEEGTMRLYGIDVGFGWTKYCWVEGAQEGGVLRVAYGKFPTAFSRYIDAVRLDDLVIHHVFEGKKYICGEDAVSSGGGFSIRDIDSLIRYAPLAVAEVLRRTWRDGLGVSEAVEIGIGLPPADYRTFKGQLGERLREVVVAGKGVVMPSRVEVYPQGVVAKVEIDLNGGMNRGLIVDIGYNTTDVIAVVDRKVLQNDVMTISMGGVSRAVKDFSDIVRFKYGVTFSTAHEAQEIMMSGKLWSMGKMVDLRDDVREILRGYVEWLTAKVRERWEERLRLAESVVAVGGGAEMLRDYFPEELKGMLRILERPEYGNSRGYLMLLGKAHSVKLVL